MSNNKIFGIYGELIKSRQTFLLLYTAVFAYLMTAWPNMFNWINFLILTLSLFFAISGSTLLNMYVDRDIDSIMERTKDRPLPSGRISAKSVLINGIVLSAVGIIIPIFVIGWLTGLIIFLGFFFDVVVYSMFLKRKTRFSIIFGGISGGLPALAGRVAVIHSIDRIGILLLLFVLAWIPVHILTLALIPKSLEGYREAKVPMWPVVRSKIETMRVIAFSGFLCAGVLLMIAHYLAVSVIMQLLLSLFCGVLILVVLVDLVKPTEKLTFLIFKFASMFMVLGFLLLFIGVIFQ